MSEYRYPDHWAFKKFANPSELFRLSINHAFDARRKAVEIKRAYISNGFNVPGWLNELTA